ncbi:3-hydroxyacyl-ACP dehydratase FabZ family protein [Streptomyces sp. NPDC127074]|uniref:3-hydroxyacyl-ACP dehydratase FabZ family protein n=1 Tax=Streptomyces sp. NPDC127074 TaxID=3347130 RepID=UPI00364CE560
MTGAAGIIEGAAMPDTRPCSPVAVRVEVVRPAAAADRGKLRAATAVTVGEDEAVFPGHYPGFPIFPGVCVIECVHLSGLRTPPPGSAALELVAVESTRFLSPVFPGDRLSVDLVWTGGSGAWKCAAKVATERGPAAQVRLRFAAEEA